MFTRGVGAVWAWAVAVCSLAAALCADAAERPVTPNVVFIVADDMRPDVIGALGHPVVRTPNLDALASEGTVFTRAVSAYPICVASRAEILTGCSAFRNGVPYGANRLQPGLALWPETLRRSGYRTCYSGKWHNDGQPKQRGYDQTSGLYSSGGGAGQTPLPDHAGRAATGYVGWTFKTDAGQVELHKGVGLTPHTDRLITDGAIDFLRAEPAGPFFLHVNFTGPHDPRIFPPGYESCYDPEQIPLPPNFATEHPFDHGNAGGRDEVLLTSPRRPEEVRGESAAYYAVVSHLDEQVGRIVSALKDAGRWQDTIVIFSSDQGLALSSHGLVGKQNLYEHTLGVPLILRGPGIPVRQRRDAACYLRDLFPTVCDLVGVPIPESVEGRSLVPVLSHGERRVYPYVIGYFTNTQRCIRDDRWKLIWYPQAARYQLFDLADDPDELRDRASDAGCAARVAELKSSLEDWLRAHGDTSVIHTSTAVER